LTIFFITGVILIIIQKVKILPMILWFFIYYAALIISRTNIHGWYLIPPLFIYITVSAIGIIFIFDKIQKKFQFNKTMGQIILLVLLVASSFIMVYQKIIQLRHQYHYEQNIRVKIGKYLKHNTKENSTVFLEPIGIIG